MDKPYLFQANYYDSWIRARYKFEIFSIGVELPLNKRFRDVYTILRLESQ